VRPRVNASTSRPASKSASCTRTRGTLASGHRRKQRYLVAGLERRRRIGHLLVHRDAPALARRERLGPALVAIAKLLQQARHRRGAARRRDLLARAAETFAQGCEIEDRD